jgi:small subunit ribosomal protein S17
MDTKKNVRKITGTVVKLSGEKTIKVKVESKYPHPKYGRIIKTHKNYLVHHDGTVENVNVNDIVEISESKPISKMKKWVLTRKIK